MVIETVLVIFLGARMKTIFLLLATGLIFSGCSKLPTAENIAKEAVSKMLNDPYSAHFGDTKKGANSGDVCGTVNAKNKMGAYVGETPFFYEKATKQATFLAIPEDIDFRMLWLSISTNSDERFKEQFADVYSKCESVTGWNRICGADHPISVPSMCDQMKNHSYEVLHHSLSEAYQFKLK